MNYKIVYKYYRYHTKSSLLLLLLFYAVGFSAQEKIEIDSIAKQEYVDTVHKPKTATIFSAIIPASGQVYNQFYKIKGQQNKLWWKLPLIYGGLGFTGYLAVKNHQNFKMFKNERLARLEDGYVSTEFALVSDNQLKVYQDQYDRWRNLSVIGGLLVYTLQLIDANVEGHLMHFDSSDDLSFDFSPSLFHSRNNYFAGLAVIISFK